MRLNQTLLHHLFEMTFQRIATYTGQRYRLTHRNAPMVFQMIENLQCGSRERSHQEAFTLYLGF